MASAKKATDSSGVNPKEYAPLTGRMPSCTPTMNCSRIARQKYGMLDRNRVLTKAPRSNPPPLNAAIAPRMLPTTHPTMIAGNWIAMLHGSAAATRELTDAGYCPKEVPRSPCSRFPT